MIYNKYIEQHKASAGWVTPAVAQTGIRDLTTEEMERFDKEYYSYYYNGILWWM